MRRDVVDNATELEDEFLSALEERLPPEITAVGVSTNPGQPQATTTAFELRELAPEHGLEP
ncbi:MAG: hypothetical protein M3Z97_14780 [Candidatus Dormibacteraeota bacterium]|nr:hypothetical protein [Candidatus Dormibacteraeota bacterium]